MARLCALMAGLVLLTSGHLRADAQLSEWIGDYAMNHDGLQGTLRIADSKRDCPAPAWCHLTVSYVDSNGRVLRAGILSVDQAFQHMAFEIAFPGNRQRFDGYLMSWDKNRFAGTTVSSGRRFGFYAFKNASPRVLQPIVRGLPDRRDVPPLVGTPAMGNGNRNARSIAADGSVQTRMPDGRIKVSYPGQCGSKFINPDGSFSSMQCAQVQPATPPFPDPVSGEWLDGHNERLLTIVRSLVDNDQASVDNYLRSEPAELTVFERIFKRTDLIMKLTEP